MTIELRPDCSRCAALCCVGLAFDRSAMFAFDKPAGEPCRNLDAGDRCRIHGELEARGFGGCVAFDCHGAGQYVTEVLFGGRSWRQTPSLLTEMMAALGALRPAHELAAMLEAAKRLPLPEAVRERLVALQAQLTPEGGWSRAEIEAGSVAAAVEAGRAFLPSLRPYADAGGRACA